MRRRKEPLYDRVGRPIIPRSREEINGPDVSWDWRLTERGRKAYEKWSPKVRAAADEAYIERLDAAEKLWGPFGRKKRFMDENPGATEAQWEKYDRERLAEWKKENGVDFRHSIEGAKRKE
jgi:hypothetical protein